MQTEIEAKWLDVNLEEFRKKLEYQGAKLVENERLMVRKIYDYPDGKLANVNGWVRVRDEGDKVTLSYKQLNDRTINGTKEVTIIVDSIEATSSFLELVGMKLVSTQETKRESWMLDGAEIELDTWPWIPSFVEIETDNESLLKNTADRLGLEISEALHGSVETAYQAVYNVTEKEIDSWEKISFVPVPDWLASKKK